MRQRDRQRRRITGALFVGNALSYTAYIGIITIAALAAEQLTGSTWLAGSPNTLGTVGSTFGAWALTLASARVGRRTAFAFGFLVSALGGIIAALSMNLGSMALLLLGMTVLGFGRSVSQLSRFAAGDLWPARKRASAIGFVVWAATIGAVAGPLLVVPTSRAGATYLGAELAGPFVFSALGFVVSALWYFVMLRPEPLTLVAEPEKVVTEEDGRPLSELVRNPTVQLSLFSLMACQFVMVFVMTMTPLHMRHHEQGLGMVSGVMMVHTLGMFAFSPLIGRIVDRWGARPVIALGGLAMLASSLLAAAAGEAESRRLFGALFLLGLGWNFCYVAGSAVLQEGLALRDRLRLQGVADSVTWASGGLAALFSGFIMAAWSFPVLALVAAGLSLVPWLALWREQKIVR